MIMLTLPLFSEYMIADTKIFVFQLSLGKSSLYNNYD